MALAPRTASSRTFAAKIRSDERAGFAVLPSASDGVQSLRITAALSSSEDAHDRIQELSLYISSVLLRRKPQNRCCHKLM